MPNLAQTFEQAEKLLQSSIECLRENSGELAQEGHHDVSCAFDQAACFLEAAIKMVDMAEERMANITDSTEEKE